MNRKTLSRKYLMAIIIILALSQIPSLIQNHVGEEQSLFLEKLPTRHWVLLLGPTLYLYARACMGRKGQIKDGLHLLPFLIWWILFQFTIGRQIQLPGLPKIYGQTNLLSLLSYSTLIFISLSRYGQRLKNQLSYRDTFKEIRWLSYMAAALMLITVTVALTVTIFFHLAPSRPPRVQRFLGDPEFIDILHALAVLIFLFLFTLLAQFQERQKPELLMTKAPTPSDLKKVKSSGGGKFNELDRFMNNSRIYLDNNLSLQKLSDETGIGRNDLSRLINNETGENFFHFINGYRAREFKACLKENRFPDFTFLAIAHECGFNSKATFNGAVKKEFNKTPSQISREIRSTL
ncbi:MAG: AraC family transcriptional regulator [Spirochaetales bacterium]|nr:AraC family transcriptional regulator [Spirochaetales bacterium]